MLGYMCGFKYAVVFFCAEAGHLAPEETGNNQNGGVGHPEIGTQGREARHRKRKEGGGWRKMSKKARKEHNARKDEGGRIGGAVLEGATNTLIEGLAVQPAPSIGGLAVQPAPSIGGLAVQPASSIGGLAVQQAPSIGGLAVQQAPSIGGLAVQPAPSIGGLAVQPTPSIAVLALEVPVQRRARKSAWKRREVAVSKARQAT
jgi:hypothetical protein